MKRTNKRNGLASAAVPVIAKRGYEKLFIWWVRKATEAEELGACVRVVGEEIRLRFSERSVSAIVRQTVKSAN
jgi:hypothetical protein